MARATPHLTHPGKQTQNACIERFNRTVRHEWPNELLLDSVGHAQQAASDRLWRYNNEPLNVIDEGVTSTQNLALAALCLLSGRDY